jgi:hypothetical protein
MSVEIVSVALVLLALAVLLNTVLLVVLWGRQDTKRSLIESVDKRVSVLEARLTDVGEVKSRLADLSHDVAALNERSETTLEMVHSIQEFLRGGSKHG